MGCLLHQEPRIKKQTIAQIVIVQVVSLGSLDHLRLPDLDTFSFSGFSENTDVFNEKSQQVASLVERRSQIVD